MNEKKKQNDCKLVNWLFPFLLNLKPLEKWDDNERKMGLSIGYKSFAASVSWLEFQYQIQAEVGYNLKRRNYDWINWHLMDLHLKGFFKKRLYNKVKGTRLQNWLYKVLFLSCLTLLYPMPWPRNNLDFNHPCPKC